MSDHRSYAPVFKGATRPATILGIPIEPFLFGNGFCITFDYITFQLAPAYTPFFLVLHVAVEAYMYLVSRNDVFALKQKILYLQTSVAGNRNRGRWGRGIVHYAPINYNDDYKPEHNRLPQDLGE